MAAFATEAISNNKSLEKVHHMGLTFNKGGFATCYMVERMEDKKLFALKII